MFHALYLAEAALITLGLSIPIQKLNCLLAHRYRWLDLPSARRRHPSPVPVTGGVGLILSWFVGLAAYCILDPSWFDTNAIPMLVIGACALTLVILGLVDDLRGLSPWWKLGVEISVAIVALTFEPNSHELCEIWSAKIGFFVWPIAVLWIVGVTNAMNLIDGLDGLAGGTAALVLASLAFLCFLVKEQTIFPLVLVITLLPAVFSFLGYNWSPAKMFLGDNGSLPLGFLIATCSLMCRPHSTSWIMVASMMLLLGYPILDTGLAAWRRYKNQQPLFKADRNHLHYRIQRLGLTPTQTTILLLSISIHLQFTGLFVNFLPPVPAALFMCITLVSIAAMFSLIYSLEQERVRRVFKNVLREAQADTHVRVSQTQTVIHLDLKSLLEGALKEEQTRYKAIIEALELLAHSLVHKEDAVFLGEQRLSIILHTNPRSEAELHDLLARIKAKADSFLSLYEIQGSLAGIPVTTEQRVIIKPAETEKAPKGGEDARNRKAG